MTGNDKWRTLARWAGSVLAMLLGVVALFAGMRAFFVANNIKTPNELALFLLSMFALLSLLPLGVLAIFRPRLAARGIGICLATVIISAYGSIPRTEIISRSVFDFLQPFLWWVALPIGILALLLYGAGPPTEHKPSAGGEEIAACRARNGMGRLTHIGFGTRLRNAQWGAVFLGVFAGGWRLWVSFPLVRRFALAHDWVGTVGAGVSALVLLPLTLLGIWKPRLAAYLLAGSLLLALAYPMHGAQNQGSALAYLLWVCVPALPVALVAGLFFYASSSPDRCPPRPGQHA